MAVPVDFLDYCGDQVTAWVDEQCACCRRVWGSCLTQDGKQPACTDRHVDGNVWRELLDTEQGAR